MKKNLWLIVLLVFSSTQVIYAQEHGPKIRTIPEDDYTLSPVITDINIPWGMVFLPDKSILVSDRGGDLILFKNNQKIKIKNVPKVYTRGQGGLLDLELHPNYKQNGWLYLSYSAVSDKEKGSHTAIMRAQIKNNSLVNKKILYMGKPFTKSSVHFGSRLEFGDDGYLYFSIGDRYNRDVNPQDLTRDGGKIYRITDDGKIPKDNPFVDMPEALPAIFTYGHRNPQGMAKNPITGDMWIHEHGPRGGDEINILRAGGNYGWPKITYGINYSGTKITDHTAMKNMQQPFYYWVPSIAPSGMTFVTSDKYPKWKGSLLVGSLVFQYLERCIIKNNKVVAREKLFPNIGRLRNVRQGPDGYLYIAVEQKGILKIVPKKTSNTR